MGRFSDIATWPETKFKDGSKRIINLTNGNSENVAACKFYFREGLPEGWCAYKYKSDGTILRMLFPKEKVPYLGVLVKEHPVEGHYMMILEPCTGSFDRPDIAKMHQQNSILKQKASISSFLSFRWKADI